MIHTVVTVIVGYLNRAGRCAGRQDHRANEDVVQGARLIMDAV